ncbi:gliding motility-associated C-terminal domain-containing protein, partial [Bacteroidales bacterium AH-315-I05]|nr:gliding motility-associated C-terminal domain-containing protein [Bacteroidales bacterium AH-315-I05]
DSNGCINYDSVTVTVNPLPVIDAGTDTAICIYDTISIGGSPTGPSGSSYSWNTTVTLSDSTLANPQVYPTSNTTYYLTVSDSNNCVSYDSIRVDVNSLPTVNAGADIQVCIFDSVQLNVTGGSSYIWTPATGLNDDSIANPLASPSDTTTYIVTGTDSNTCKNTDTVTVVVNPLPNANAGAGVQICIYDTIQLIATGGEIYNWLPMDSLSDNSNDTTLAWPTDTTSYVVTVTDSNTCVNTDTVVVTVNPLPVIDAGTDTAICIFDSIVIGGSPTGPVGSVYSWLPNDSIITTTSQNPIVFPTSTTEYFLVVNDSNGCVNDDSISITVNNLPVIDAGNDVQVCIYDSVQLNATGGIIYVWTPDIGLSDDSIADPLVSPSDTTMYYVTGADSNTCSNVDSVTVIVNPLPPADAGNDVQICLGDTTQLNATGGIIYAWLPDTMLSDDSVSNPFAFPLDTTDYVVTVTDTNSCENTDTVTITVNPLPLTDAGIDTAICIGDTFLIGGSPTGPAGSSFEWMPSEGLGDTISANPPASPDTTTKYFVIATDSNGCILTDSVLITVNYLPIAYAGADTQICIYDTVQLNATGGIVYLWSPADSINDTAAFNPLVWPSDTMEYVVLVTDSNGCMNIDSVVVVVNPLPNADAGADEYICRSDSITLTATGGESYSWSPATEIANPDSSSPTVFPQIPTTYFVEVTDSNSCRNTDSVSVNVFRIFGGDTSICENATIVLGLNSTGIPFSYLWSPAIYLNDSSLANPTASPDEEGDITYTVIVNDSGICVDSTEVNLTIHIQPSANFSVTYIPQCDEVSGEFINSSIDADWYHWDFGTADTANTTDADYDFSYQGTPSVTLIAYNQYCSDTIESDSTLQSFIEYLDVTVSNVFSPNNDGINDYFAVGVNPSLIECTKLQIYNRWGQLMFIDTEGVKMWDGKNIFNGRNVPAGVYYYVFSINDLPPINGSVTVNY